ncbi:membrane hypothetical protein [Candidatus Terasakiella magnetica]|nr:membrane hypothetical protein [Candidatus Terasakiella magnetica]
MPPATAGKVYTCPMHPQIQQQGPGSCPICGMALEQRDVSAVATPNRELADMTRRFWIGLALTLPVFVLEMGGHIPALGLHDLVSSRISTWIQFGLATPVVLWAGWPFFQRGGASVLSRHLNMFTLIALGTGAAYLYSLVATFAPGVFPSGFRMMDGAVAVYYEAAAVITVLVLLGQVLELRARDQTGGAIRALLNLAPKTAYRLKETGEDEEIPLEQIQVGNRLRVRHQRCGRIHGLRRVDAGRQGAGRQTHRRHRQQHRLLGYDCRQDRGRYHAVAHRAHGGGGRRDRRQCAKHHCRKPGRIRLGNGQGRDRQGRRSRRGPGQRQAHG